MSLFKNISYLNKTRIQVNTSCWDNFVKNKKHVTIDFKYNTKKESYKIYEEMPVLATTNLRDKKIFNTMEFKIDRIEDDYIHINNHIFYYSEFSESFIPAFCVTV